jgi:hypothetical protein
VSGFMAHSRPVFNPRTKRRSPIRPRKVRRIVTDIVGRSYRSIRRNEMSAMFAGVAFTVVFSIPALVREIRLARRYESPAAVRPGPQLASR